MKNNHNKKLRTILNFILDYINKTFVIIKKYS